MNQKITEKREHRNDKQVAMQSCNPSKGFISRQICFIYLQVTGEWKQHLVSLYHPCPPEKRKNITYMQEDEMRPPQSPIKLIPSLYFTSGRTERIVSASHAAVELGIASSFDGSVLAIVFEEMGVLPTANGQVVFCTFVMLLIRHQGLET